MTAKTKTKRLQRLLSHGYFAPELPPCFVSNDLARHRRSLLSSIDRMPQIQRKPAHYRFISEPVWFYFPRFGKDDRRHGVPNPIAHLLLSRAVADNYVALRRVARASKLSLSPPLFDWSGNRALVRPSVELRDEFRADLSARREAYAIGDIRAFFHSIYTHSIAWAVHGKAFAKANRGDNYYGNLIDLLCRNAQDGQTIGLPVGPDTSRIVAEVVASAMDVWLQQHLGIGFRDASRYIDDYTISSGSNEGGDELLAALRRSASMYELELNSDKSAIVSTSARQNTGWQQAVRSCIPRALPMDTPQFQQYVYELGRLCDEHPEINVEKFGLQNARSAIVGANSWGPVQSNLIGAYRRNPSLVSLLVEIFLLRQVSHEDLRLDELCEFIENRIAVLARANRTGEAIWLLFLAIRLQITLSAQSLAALSQMENAIVALLVTCLVSRGLVRGAVDRSLWDRSLSEAGLRSSMWLYAYEAVTQGFLDGVNDDFINRDPYFALLHARGIQFLEIERGFTSMGTTLRGLRNENQRLQFLREAIREGDIEELDDSDADQDDEEGDDTDSDDIY